MKAAGTTPVTVKCRLDSERGAKLKGLLEGFAGAGVAVVTLHPRTKKEGYRGKADRGAFRELASGAPLPMVYSGDVLSGSDVREVYRETGASAIMIGRAAISNPWIFEEARAAMEDKKYSYPPMRKKLEEFIAFRDGLLGLFGEEKGLLEIRKFVGHLLRGERDSRQYIQAFYKASSPKEQDRALNDFLENAGQPSQS